MKKIFLFLVLCYSIPFSSYASKLPDFYRSGIAQTGNTARIGTTGGLTVFPGVGNANPTLLNGWTQAGNFGVSPAATGLTMNLGHAGDVFFSGVKYPFQAGYSVPVGTLVDAAIAVSSGPLGVAIFAAPFLLDWFNKSGGRLDPVTGAMQRLDPSVCSVAPCYLYSSGFTTLRSFGSREKAAADFMTQWSAQSANYIAQGSPWFTGSGANVVAQFSVFSRSTGLYGGVQGGNLVSQTTSPSAPVYLPSSMNDIAPYMRNVNPDGRVFKELLDRGADIPMPSPTVTGPASVDGPQNTTQNPDGTRTVEKTTYNFNNSGDTITKSNSVTNVTIYNNDNSVKSSSVSTKTTTPTDQAPNPCDLAPDSIGCSKMGTITDKPLPPFPVLYVPKYPDGLTGVWATRIADIKSSPLFNATANLMPSVASGGSCPVWMIPLNVGIKDFGTHDVAPPCWIWTFGKFVIVVSALFLARSLVFGG